MPLMELAGIDLGILKRAAAGPVVRDEALDQGPSLKQHVVALHRSWFVRKLGPMSWPIMAYHGHLTRFDAETG